MRLPFRGILRHPERPSDIANPAGTETGAFLEDQTTLIPTSPLHLHSFVAIQVGSMKTPDLSSEASYPDQRPAWTNPSIPLIATISLCFLTSAFQEKSRSHHLPMPRKYNSCFPTSVRKDLLTPQSSASLLDILQPANPDQLEYDVQALTVCIQNGFEASKLQVHTHRKLVSFWDKQLAEVHRNKSRTKARPDASSVQKLRRFSTK